MKRVKYLIMAVLIFCSNPAFSELGSLARSHSFVFPCESYWKTDRQKYYDCQDYYKKYLVDEIQKAQTGCEESQYKQETCLESISHIDSLIIKFPLAFQKNIFYSPAIKFARYQIALTYLKLNDLENAYKYYKLQVKNSSAPSDWYNELAGYYSSKGERKKAEQNYNWYWSTVTEFNPGIFESYVEYLKKNDEFNLENDNFFRIFTNGFFFPIDIHSYAFEPEECELARDVNLEISDFQPTVDLLKYLFKNKDYQDYAIKLLRDFKKGQRYSILVDEERLLFDFSSNCFERPSMICREIYSDLSLNESQNFTDLWVKRHLEHEYYDVFKGRMKFIYSRQIINQGYGVLNVNNIDLLILSGEYDMLWNYLDSVSNLSDSQLQEWSLSGGNDLEFYDLAFDFFTNKRAYEEKINNHDAKFSGYDIMRLVVFSARKNRYDYIPGLIIDYFFKAQDISLRKIGKMFLVILFIRITKQLQFSDCLASSSSGEETLSGVSGLIYSCTDKIYGAKE